MAERVEQREDPGVSAARKYEELKKAEQDATNAETTRKEAKDHLDAADKTYEAKVKRVTEALRAQVSTKDKDKAREDVQLANAEKEEAELALKNAGVAFAAVEETAKKANEALEKARAATKETVTAKSIRKGKEPPAKTPGGEKRERIKFWSVIAVLIALLVTLIILFSIALWPCTPGPCTPTHSELPTKAQMNEFLFGAWYEGICNTDITNRISLAFPNSEPTWKTKDGALLLYVTVQEGTFQVAWHQEGSQKVGSLVP